MNEPPVAFEDLAVPMRRLPPTPPSSAQTPGADDVAAEEVDGPVEEPAPEPAQQQVGAPGGPVILSPAPVPATPRAMTGKRGAIRRLTGGRIAFAASARELAEQQDRDAVLGQLSKTMTILVANPKGGAGKTPTVVGLAGTFGKIRGGSVLAWDNNETRGTLAIRVTRGTTDATAVDLKNDLPRFEHVAAERGALSRYLRHQRANFDVLGSDEDPRLMSQIGHPEFRRMYRVLGRHYELMVIDTGNNSRADNYLSAALIADAIVIPVRWAQDIVTSAAWLCEQLAHQGFDRLLERAVTVVTGSPAPGVSPAQVAQWRDYFTATTRAVVEVPYDPHIATGGAIEHDQLAPATQRAYLRAAAILSDGFRADR